MLPFSIYIYIYSHAPEGLPPSIRIQNVAKRTFYLNMHKLDAEIGLRRDATSEYVADELRRVIVHIFHFHVDFQRAYGVFGVLIRGLRDAIFSGENGQSVV